MDEKNPVDETIRLLGPEGLALHYAWLEQELTSNGTEVSADMATASLRTRNVLRCSAKKSPLGILAEPRQSRRFITRELCDPALAEILHFMSGCLTSSPFSTPSEGTPDGEPAAD
jgi:hypothetical protein